MTNIYGLHLGSTPPISSVSGIAGLQPGVKQTASYLYAVTPATTNTGALFTNLTFTSTGPFPAGSGATITASSGVTAVTYSGSTYYQFDCPRAVTFVGSSVCTLPVSVFVNGLDWYNQVQTWSGTVGSGQVQVTTTKTFSAILNITFSGNTQSGMNAGIGDNIGAPYYFDNAGEVRAVFAGTTLTATNTVSGATGTATATTADVRGYFTLPSASDGTKRLFAQISVLNPDTRNTVYGVVPA